MFAEEHQVACVDPDTMKSPRAENEWKVWRDQFDSAAKVHEGAIVIDRKGLSDRQDTVGAVALDTSGGLAAGVSRYDLFTDKHTNNSRLIVLCRICSSGGLLLKPPGRIGEVREYTTHQHKGTLAQPHLRPYPGCPAWSRLLGTASGR